MRRNSDFTRIKLPMLFLAAFITISTMQLFAKNADLKGKNETKPITKLAQTPPLGWNSFDSYGINIYEELAMKEIDAFIEKFAPHGYEYFVIDNGWFAYPPSEKYKGYLMPVSGKVEVYADAYGIPTPSKQYFPNGLKPMIEKLHAKGLKFGVHLMRGIPRVAVEQNLPIKGTKYTAKDIYTTFDDCTWCKFKHGVDMTKPGSQEYYNSVFKQFAEWGIDFVKVDHVTHFAADVEGYAKAIEQCGRPMVLSLSAGGTSNIRYLESYKKANMVRTTPDIWDDQIAIERSFESMRKWQGLEMPGFWPDLDMIPFGELCILRRTELEKKGEKKASEQETGKSYHWCRFTEPQKETFITQRAIAASPIMVGGSMINMDDHSMKLLTHPEMLACVKNSVHGKLIHVENDIEVWSAPIANKDRWGHQEYMYKNGWTAVFNRTDKVQNIELSGKFLNFMMPGNYNISDVWGKQSVKDYKKGAKLNFTIEPNGVVFFKYSQVNASK